MKAKVNATAQQNPTFSCVAMVTASASRGSATQEMIVAISAMNMAVSIVRKNKIYLNMSVTSCTVCFIDFLIVSMFYLLLLTIFIGGALAYLPQFAS